MIRKLLISRAVFYFYFYRKTFYLSFIIFFCGEGGGYRKGKFFLCSFFLSSFMFLQVIFVVVRARVQADFQRRSCWAKMAQKLLPGDFLSFYARAVIDVASWPADSPITISDDWQWMGIYNGDNGNVCPFSFKKKTHYKKCFYFLSGKPLYSMLTFVREFKLPQVCRKIFFFHLFLVMLQGPEF